MKTESINSPKRIKALESARRRGEAATELTMELQEINEAAEEYKQDLDKTSKSYPETWKQVEPPKPVHQEFKEKLIKALIEKGFSKDDHNSKILYKVIDSL